MAYAFNQAQGDQQADREGFGLPKSARTLRNMLQRMTSTNDMREFLHSLNVDEATILARSLGMNEYASGMDAPGVLKLFKIQVDRSISLSGFRETALDIMAFGEGATEAVVEAALFRSSKTVTGRELLGEIGIPLDDVHNMSRIQGIDEFRERLDSYDD